MNAESTMETGTDDVLVLKASRRKAATLVIIAVGIAAGGYYMMAVMARGQVGMTILGIFVITFAVVCGSYALLRFVRPGMAVQIDRTGIVDGASGVSAGRMEWDEIATAEVYEFMGQTMLGIMPRNLDAFLRRQPAWRRLMYRANMALGCPPVNLPESILPVSAGEVLTAMERIGGRTWRGTR